MTTVLDIRKKEIKLRNGVKYAISEHVALDPLSENDNFDEEMQDLDFGQKAEILNAYIAQDSYFDNNRAFLEFLTETDEQYDLMQAILPHAVELIDACDSCIFNTTESVSIKIKEKTGLALKSYLSKMMLGYFDYMTTLPDFRMSYDDALREKWEEHEYCKRHGVYH